MRMFLAPLALTVALAMAAPSDARRARPRLPLPPAGVDYVETICAGGIAGMSEQTRVLVTGQVTKITSHSTGVQRTQATRGELLSLWRQLARARFDQRTAPPEKPYVMDGIDCTLISRKRGEVHSVNLMQQQRDKPQYRDLGRIIELMNEIARRAAGPIAL